MPRCLTRSFEEVTRPTIVVRDAPAVRIIFASLLARRKVLDLMVAQIDLAFGHVTLRAGEYCEGQAEREDHATQDTPCHFFLLKMRSLSAVSNEKNKVGWHCKEYQRK
jgi:hypothetical protein